MKCARGLGALAPETFNRRLPVAAGEPGSFKAEQSPMKFLGKGRKNFKSLWKSDSEANNSRSFKKAPQTIKQNKSLGGKMFWIRLGFKKGQEVLISDVTLLQEDKKCYWSGVSVIQLWWRSNRDPVVDFDPTIVGQGFNSTARFQLKWSKLLCLNWSGSGWYEKKR